MLIAKEYIRGLALVVWLLYKDNHSCQTVDFIADLDEVSRKKLNAYLDRVAANGPPVNEEKFKWLDGDICEFKSHGVRMLAFKTTAGFVITNGFKKPKKRETQLEIEKARRLRGEFLRGERYGV